MEKNFSYFKKEVESLIYYGGEDEMFELWCKLIGICHDFANFGETEKASVVLDWIKEITENVQKETFSNAKMYGYDSVFDIPKVNGIFTPSGGLY